MVRAISGNRPGRQTRSLPAGEAARKLVHAAMGLFALLLPFLSWPQAASCAVLAFLFNWLVLPRLFGHRFKTERVGASDAGVLLYPLVVLALIFVFRHRLELAAFGWGVLAFGDALAGLVGQKWGCRPLPWNREKTWEGFWAFVVGSTLGGSLLAIWYLAVREPEARAWPALALGLSLWVAWGLVPSILGAVLESVPCGLDDNVIPPLAVPLVGLLGSEGAEVLGVTDLGLAVLANTTCAFLALAGKALRPSGVAAAWILGVATWAAGGWQAFVLLLGFLLAGLAATFLGYGRKRQRGVAEAQQGRRGAGEVLAKSGVLLAVVLEGWGAGFTEGGLVGWAVVACLAAAWADTWGSELGGLWGRRVWRLPDFRPVPAGTAGGVSLPGLVASLAGAVFAVALGRALGLLGSEPAGWLVVAAGFSATLVESLVARVPRATHGGRNLLVTVLPLVLLVALTGGRL